MKLAEERGTSPPISIAEEAKFKYNLTNLISDSFCNKAKAVWNVISTGGNMPSSPPVTRIYKPTMLYCVAFIIDHCQFCPGKLCNVRVSYCCLLFTYCFISINYYLTFFFSIIFVQVYGHLLKDLPFHLRYTNVNTLYDLYKDSLVSRGVQEKKFFVGYNSFRIILNTIARPGSYNQSLSYFYVDLLNCIYTKGLH